MTAPSYTIIIATHERPQLLERSIRSVINQTYSNKRLVVVSDVIDDKTYATATQLLREDDIFIQRKGRPGPAESRNLAILFAHGTHVVFLDDDDAFSSDFLENLSKFLVIQEARKIVYVNAQLIDYSSNALPQFIDFTHRPKDELWLKNFLPNNCVIYPTYIAKEISFENNLAYEDWDYLLSAARLNELVHAPIYGPIVYKNSDKTSIHRGEQNKNELIDCYIKIYKKHASINSNISKMRNDLFNSLGLDPGSFI